MTKEAFINYMNDILDSKEEITMDSVLGNIEEWDSLSCISFITMANVRQGKNLSMKDIKKAVTISDLFALVEKD